MTHETVTGRRSQVICKGLRTKDRGQRSSILPILLFAVLGSVGCRQRSSPPAPQGRAVSAVLVTVNPGGPVVIKTASAEFDLLASGYLQAYLVKDGRRLTLDEPSSVGESLVAGSKEIRDFTLDFEHVKVSDAQGKLGTLGEPIFRQKATQMGREFAQCVQGKLERQP